MRNVESLRSVGVYLDTETRAYYPDFVLWAVSDKKTHVLLVDPKGQSGIRNWDSLDAFNAKVKLAKSQDLLDLANKLTTQTKKAFTVDSLILLRKSSPLGTANGALYNTTDVERLEALHILHMNWAPKNEQGMCLDEDGDALPHPPEHRCYLERMFASSGLLPSR